ncbi:MAG: 23S rRNA (uracil(1939)-C(5))-methyltransferase RlmD [Clostridiales bacterium]|nr:23S rRNA (uracil(1939)-C(5))-methyltransferase RlmD [Clostridiales bacterium]
MPQGCDRKKTVLTCPAAGKCGGCIYAGKTYEETLRIKEQYIKGLLKGKAGDVMPVIPADDPFFYRNKIYISFGRDKSGPVSGRFAEGSHKICQVSSCLIEDKIAADIEREVMFLVKRYKMTIYDEKSRKGLLRGVLVRTAKETGEVMVVVVTSAEEFKGRRNFTDTLIKKVPSITTVVININTRTDSMILGDRSSVAYGKGYIIDKLCGLSFKISPESFYQINHDQTEKLYDTAFEMARIGEKDTVLDAYSGIGTIGLIASKRAGSVVSVELNPKAVKDAKENAAHNKVTNIKTICGDATAYMEKAAASGQKFDVVILDPPRSGTTKEFIEACRKISPDWIVYISCGPEALARDLDLFADAGYMAEKAVPVDLFCFTGHIETVALISKRLSR